MNRESKDILTIIDACREGDRASQRQLYQLYFSYAMSVALRYTGTRTEAEEVLNDGFYKVFTHLDLYNPQYEFKKWLRTILINCSIDYFRKYKKLQYDNSDAIADTATDDGSTWNHLLYQDLLKHIQVLPPRYRLVFNLYAVDGYKHHEIAAQLNISEGTSKSNFAKAKKILQKHLSTTYDIKLYRDGR